MTLNTFLCLLGFFALGAATLKLELPRVHFGWLGMALWMLTVVLGGVKL